MQLVKICTGNYGWAQSTVFTLMKRMQKKGVLENKDAKLQMLINRQDYYHEMAKKVVSDNYQGSLALFLQDYFYNEGISKKDAGKVMNIIRSYTKER